MEIWKNVRGYEGQYIVSSKGRVESVARTLICSNGTIRTLKGHEKLPSIDKDGYLTVKLSRRGKDKRVRVHRVVAEAFIGAAPFDGAEINHKDYNRCNNDANNLEWLAHGDNIHYSSDVGRYHVRRPRKRKKLS